MGHYLLLFSPLGFYYCYAKPTNARLFVAIFGVCSVYFSCVMVRLLLLSSPALCLLSGIGVSELIHFFVKQFKKYNDNDEEEPEYLPAEEKSENKKEAKKDSAKKKKTPKQQNQKAKKFTDTASR